MAIYQWNVLSWRGMRTEITESPIRLSEGALWAGLWKIKLGQDTRWKWRVSRGVTCAWCVGGTTRNPVWLVCRVLKEELWGPGEGCQRHGEGPWSSLCYRYRAKKVVRQMVTWSESSSENKNIFIISLVKKKSFMKRISITLISFTKPPGWSHKKHSRIC